MTKDEALTIFPWAIDDDSMGAVANKVTKLQPKVLKQFADKVYNQLYVDPYACTIVSTAGALTSYTKKEVGYELMINALNKMKKDGAFREGRGAYLKDGVKYMVDEFNDYYGTNITPHLIELNEENIFKAFDTFHSPVVTGMMVTSKYFEDEQDNAIIDKGEAGRIGHAIYICKINTTDPNKFQMKYIESYFGAKSKYGLAKDIIYVDFRIHNGVFFNTGFYFTWK